MTQGAPRERCVEREGGFETGWKPAPTCGWNLSRFPRPAISVYSSHREAARSRDIFYFLADEPCGLLPQQTNGAFLAPPEEGEKETHVLTRTGDAA
jgi:hypothetical protein